MSVLDENLVGLKDNIEQAVALELSDATDAKEVQKRNRVGNVALSLKKVLELKNKPLCRNIFGKIKLPRITSRNKKGVGADVTAEVRFLYRGKEVSFSDSYTIVPQWNEMPYFFAWAGKEDTLSFVERGHGVDGIRETVVLRIDPNREYDITIGDFLKQGAIQLAAVMHDRKLGTFQPIGKFEGDTFVLGEGYEARQPLKSANMQVHRLILCWRNTLSAHPGPRNERDDLFHKCVTEGPTPLRRYLRFLMLGLGVDFYEGFRRHHEHNYETLDISGHGELVLTMPSVILDGHIPLGFALKPYESANTN